MTRLVAVLVLIVALLAGVVATPALTGRGADARLAAAPVEGADACGLLPDDDLLQATRADGVSSRRPGPLPGLDAGCTWDLGPVEDGLAEWTIFMSIKSPGGRAWFDLYAAEGLGEPIAGLGDAALEDGGSGVIAVKGDTFVMLTVIGGGRDAPAAADVARQLAGRLMSRLEVAPLPSTTPAPSAMPRSAARDLVIRLRAPEFEDDTINAATELLARSGIATYESPSSAGPMVPVTGLESPLMLLRDQVRAMALEAWAGGGILGADLDPLVPTDPDLAPPSWLLAGYVASAETEGADVARLLMGEQDWTRPGSVVFPQLVLALFTSDIARDRLAEAGAAAGPRVSRRATLAMVGELRTAQGGLCSAASAFLDGALARIFDALRLGDTGGGNVLKSIWNFVVSIAEQAVRAIVKEFTQRVLDMIGRVAAMAGLVSMIVSAVRPWTVTVTVVPPVTVKGVGGSPGQSGRLLARVDLGGLETWPPVVADCARVAGRPLPNLKPEGAVVTWTPIQQSPAGLVAEGPRQDRLDAQAVATFDFVTLTDDIPAPWQEYEGHLTSAVTIERPQLQQLANLALDELFAELDGARGIIEPYLRPVLQELTSRLGELITSNAAGTGTVIYHLPAATPAPSASPPPPTARARAVMVRLDRPQIGAAEAGTVLELFSCTGPYGHWSGVIRFGGIDAGEGLSVPWADLGFDFQLEGSGGIRRAFRTVSGTIPSNIPAITYDIDAFLDFTVDGTTMEVLGRVNLSEQIEGRNLMGGSELGVPVSLPIEPAPAGTCP